MSLLPGLVLLHLGVTALLLGVFITVVAWQHASDLVRRSRVLHRTAAVARPQEAGASVLDWTIDLRTPAAAESGVVLQQTS